MRLRIKNPKVHRLAKKLAAITGESITHAVAVALRDRLERLQGRKRRMTVDEMLALGRRIRKELRLPTIDHAGLLYDERGLPK